MYCACTRFCTNVSVCACMFVADRIRVRVYTPAYMYACACARSRANVCVCACTLVAQCICVHVYALHKCMRVRAHAPAQTYACACVCPCTHSYVCVCTCVGDRIAIQHRLLFETTISFFTVTGSVPQIPMIIPFEYVSTKKLSW